MGFLADTTVPAGAATSYPIAPPAAMCASPAMNGPTAAPSGAVIVTPGGPGLDTLTNASPAGTTFYLLGGTHLLGTPGAPNIYDQVIPKTANVYIGAPGAVLDGQNVDHSAFTQTATGVKITYLTIQHFNAYQDQGVVNHDSANGWTIDHNTIVANHGAALMAGATNQITSNCLADNGQYGINAYQTGDGITGLVIDHNEIAGNNTDNLEFTATGAMTYCGCTGGMKFWANKATSVTNNWVHDNKSVGIWADTNDTGFTITGNLVENNDSEGIFYEISYNATIAYNTLRGNAIVKGKAAAARGDNFPVAALYLSESGGDARVSPGPAAIDIHDNNFDNNWSGVTLWENADRFCDSPNNTSGSYCTLGGTATLAACVQPGMASQPLYSDCRWKTQNVKVHNNVFNTNLGTIGCADATYCARQAVISNWGTSPAWSPYQGTTVQQAITSSQGNVWSNNTYTGTWQFMPFDTGHLINLAAWQAAPYNQDAGSTSGTGTPPLTTTTTTTVPAPTTTTSTTVRPTTTTTTVAPTPAGTNALDANTAGLEAGSGKWSSWFAANVSQSTLQAHGGTHSLRVDITAPYGWGAQLNNWPGFSATPGPKTIGFWARAGSGANLSASMNVKWRDASGKDLKVDTLTVPALSGTWKQATANVTAPAGTATVHVEAVNASGLAKDFLYLDDFTVTSAGAPAAPLVNTLDADTSGLEAGTGKWASWFASTVSQTVAQAHGGTHSLRVDVTAPYGWGAQLNNWPGFSATAGNKTIGLWGRTGTGANLAVSMNVRWRDASGRVLQVDTVTIPALSATWQQATANVTAPAGTAAVGIEAASSTGVAGSSLYLDDFVVVSR